MKIKKVYSGLSDVSSVMSFIDEQLSISKIDKKKKNKAMLLAEESYVELCNTLPENEEISVYAIKRLGKKAVNAGSWQ